MLEYKHSLYLEVIANGLNKNNSRQFSSKEHDLIDWNDFFKFCKNQAILGIGFHSMILLKNKYPSNVNISRTLFFKWIAITEQIKKQNLLLNKRCCELSLLFSNKSKASCILKGQGNALIYPNPLLRVPGDIDVWVEGTKREVSSFVHEYFPDENIQYHHMNFPIFTDVDVEVHYYPSYCYNKINNYNLQLFFKKQALKQFDHKVILNGDYAKISTPTTFFNLVFQLSHMMRHFFTQGIGLRQSIDYYYLLSQDISKEEKIELVKVLKKVGMYKFFQAILWIEIEILGLTVNTDIAIPNEKAGRMVLNEMLKGGNFGVNHHNKAKTRLGFFANQILYNFRYVWIFPSEPLWRPFSLIYDYIIKHFFSQK